MSPRLAVSPLVSSPAGKDRTSVALSIPRNRRFNSLIWRSETKAIVAWPDFFRIVLSAFSLKDSQLSGSMRTLRCRLTTSIIRWEPRVQLDVALLGVIFVGADDHLHEFMADHIFLGKVNKLDPLQVREHSLSFYQTTAFACG